MLASLLAASACATPLRRPSRVRAVDARAHCGIRSGVELTREQALCVAGLAGLRVEEGAYEIRTGKTLADQPVWIVEERCAEHRTDCLGISIAREGGQVLNPRWLFVKERYPGGE